jgi:hypothetical protein
LCTQSQTRRRAMTSVSRRTPRHWPASGTRRGPASGVSVCTSGLAGECHPLSKSSPAAPIPNSRSPDSRFGRNRETGNPRFPGPIPEAENGNRGPDGRGPGIRASGPRGPVRPLGDNRKTRASRLVAAGRAWPSTDGSQDPGRSGPSLVMLVPELASDGTLHRGSWCLLVVLYSPQ